MSKISLIQPYIALSTLVLTGSIGVSTRGARGAPAPPERMGGSLGGKAAEEKNNIGPFGLHFYYKYFLSFPILETIKLISEASMSAP